MQISHRVPISTKWKETQVETSESEEHTSSSVGGIASYLNVCKAVVVEAICPNGSGLFVGWANQVGLPSIIPNNIMWIPLNGFEIIQSIPKMDDQAIVSRGAQSACSFSQLEQISSVNSNAYEWPLSQVKLLVLLLRERMWSRSGTRMLETGKQLILIDSAAGGKSSDNSIGSMDGFEFYCHLRVTLLGHPS